ncbi:MAG: hypothetical protein JW891_12270 [Candidatus Lokiarchaeota archaeon]|nr:hypothetical protein [Candidatus Lokiarchaeota archaeon]
MSERERCENEKDNNIDDELDKQWEMQDQIHHKCKMRDDPEEKLKKWKEKHG